MGCGASRQGLVMSGALQGSCSIKAEDGQLYSCEYAGRTLAKRGKNQDRFGLRFAGGALTVGIFDGHSVHDSLSGIRHAEEACLHLTKGLHPQASPPPSTTTLAAPTVAATVPTTTLTTFTLTTTFTAASAATAIAATAITTAAN